MPDNLEALRAQLARRAGKRECPFCGFTEWGHVDTGFLLQEIQPEGPTEWAKGLPTIALFCLHCGFVRQHAVEVLEPDDPSHR